MNRNELHNNLNLTENILHGIILTDWRGHITYWNRASERIFGYTEEEIIGKPIRKLYDDDTIPFKDLLTESYSGKSIHGTWHARCKENKRIWLDVRARILKGNDGNPVSFLISVCDIDKLKSTERTLQENSFLAEAIIDTSPDAIITVNEDGIIQSFNGTAIRMFGYDKAEAIGKNIDKLLPLPYSEDYKIYLQTFDLKNQKDSRNQGIEIQGLNKDGTVFPIELMVSEVSWEGEQIYVGMIRDLSRRRKLERKIFEIGSEERRRIGRDLHDGMGQMLTGIRMLSENLAHKLQLNGLPCADEVQEISEMIREADEYARVLSHGLIYMDSENKGLSVAIENLCKRVMKTTGLNCTFDSVGNIDDIHQSAVLQLYRIAQEAINNAAKHSDGKTIHVRLSMNDQHLSLTIDDDGSGFDIDDNKKNGSGIQIMKYRAGILGGLLEIKRTRNERTQVRCIVPNNLIMF
jgi:two-component system, LuxR family, sensor kinase FixL